METQHVRMKCKVCGSEWNETYKPTDSSYAVCPAGKGCTTLVQTRKTGEVLEPSSDERI